MNGVDLGFKPKLQVLDENQIEHIHMATLEVLERTGVRIPHPRALEVLDGAGARVDGERVRIPASTSRSFTERTGGWRTTQPFGLSFRSTSTASQVCWLASPAHRSCDLM